VQVGQHLLATGEEQVPRRDRPPQHVADGWRGDAQFGELGGDQVGERRRVPAAQVHLGQPGQFGHGGVVEAGRQHVFPPLLCRPAEGGAAFQPGPVPGGVVGGEEHHHRPGLLGVDGGEFVGQIPPPQPHHFVGVEEHPHPAGLQRRRHLFHIRPLGAGERQRHLPPAFRGTRWWAGCGVHRHSHPACHERSCA
jgi:hypothetical protein